MVILAQNKDIHEIKIFIFQKIIRQTTQKVTYDKCKSLVLDKKTFCEKKNQRNR